MAEAASINYFEAGQSGGKQSRGGEEGCDDRNVKTRTDDVSH